MAYDLRATLKLNDEFTGPIKTALRAFDNMEKQMRQTDSLWDDIERSANQATDQVRRFSNETQQGSQNAADLERQLDLARREADRLGDAGNNVGDNLDRAGDAGHTAGGKIGSAFKAAAGIIATVFAVDQLKDLSLSMVEASGGAKAMEAQFSEVFGKLEGEAGSRLGAIGKESTILENRMKGSFTKIAAFAKTGGMSTADSLDLADRSMRTIADSAAFYDRSLEDTTESLQSFLKGNFENDAALGLSATETTRNFAATELYGKSFKKLSEAQKQLTLLKMVEDANKVSGAMGQAARESDGLENVIGNMKQSWTDLKSVMGESVLNVAITGMQSLTEQLQKIDGQALADKLAAAGAYMSETFGPIVGEVKEDLQSLWDVLSGGEAEDGMQSALDSLQTGMHWIAENWEGVKDGVVALAVAFGAYKLAVAGMAIFSLINGLMLSYTAVAGTTTFAQWALNTAMAANPISLVALAIAGLVGAGVLLYQNWDIVREKTEALWDKLGAFKGVATLVLGPIGFIIRAAVTMADQWDSTKSIWENVWNGIAKAAENSVNDVIGSINALIEKINKIPGVNIPIIAKVDWVDDNVTPSSKMAKEMSYAEAVSGSHATGLASVPYDGYIAELHKGEPVLTSQQGDVLRNMGVLKSSGNKPVIDTGALNDRNDSQTSSKKFKLERSSLSIGNIIVQGHNKPTKEIAREIVDEVVKVIANGALAGDH